MIYYIFGSDTSEFKVNRKKAIFESDDIRECLEKFNRINMNYKYKHSYMVADFEINCNHGLFDYSSIIFGEDTIPFLIVAEFHEDMDGSNPKNTILSDCLVIKRDGYSHQFKNNVKALEKFEFLIRNEEDATLSIRYKYTNDSDKICINEAVIATVGDIIDYNGLDYKINRFILKPLEWVPDPVEKTFNFSM